jgi:hypothetical protein
MTGRAISSWSANPNIDVLGNHDAERLSIVSFVVRYGSRYLHHNFVVALLNDLFGIQSRGGCSCAGPYGHRLLGIDLERSHEFEREITRGCEGIKPGWVRVNFNYFISAQVRDFVLDAVHFVADEGWRFLPYYSFDPTTALWRHRRPLTEPPLSLGDIEYGGGQMEYRHRPRLHSDDDLAGYLDEARKLVAGMSDSDLPEPLELPLVTEDFEYLRWFPLPDELRDSAKQAR